MASFSASTEPVSLIAMVPVTECKMPTVTSVSVTASPVVLTAAVAGASARANCGSIADDDKAAAPTRSPRRVGLRRFPVFASEDMRRLDSAMVVGHRGERTSLLESKTAPKYAVQHTSIDVYAYVKRRIILRTNREFAARCAQNANTASYLFFCAAHCLNFRHERAGARR